MWSQDIQSLNHFEDLNIKEYREPIIRSLETALINAKPKNNLYFIKKWAQKQMKQLQSEDDEYIKDQELLKGQKKLKNKQKINKRRNGIVMAQVDQNEQWNIFNHKDKVIKNQQFKSKVMLSLKQIPFLVNLGWQQINQLTHLAQLRQYGKEQRFAKKGQLINTLYIIVKGSMIKQDDKKKTTIEQGSIIFIESLISISYSPQNYYISDQNTIICGISAYKIHLMVQTSNQKKESIYQKMLMSVTLFNYLDRQQFYKLVSMIQIISVKKANQVIVENGSPAQSLYLVIKGQFLLCKHNLSQQIVSFQSFKEGQVFGENWLTRPTLAECSVVSKTQGILGFVSRKQIQKSISSIDKLVLRKKAKQLD